jgi:hypothetical protein
MSWGALPWFIYEMQHERFQADCLCCFPEEFRSGITRATPQHVVQMQQMFLKDDLTKNKHDSLIDKY